MHRDIRLHGLSSDHHHALVLARTIRKAFDAGTADAALVDDVHRSYQNVLKQHFAIEEELLLVALSAVGEEPLASRTRSEHAELHALVESARQGKTDALRLFGVLLEAHVRFEEKELFPTCERKLDDTVLDAVAARVAKRGEANDAH